MSLNTALISIDVVAFQLVQGRLKLLARETELPNGEQVLMLPAGRIDPEQDRNLDDTALRQLRLHTTQDVAYIEQVTTIGNPVRDSRGWSMTVVYYALLATENNDVVCSKARWIDVTGGQPSPSLAFDHNKLVTQALERLKNKIQYSSLPVYLLPDEFTLSDIQKVFAGILDKAPPMRSIRNRFLKGDLLMDTGKLRRGSNRPAVLYKVNNDSKTYMFDRLYLSIQ